VTTTTGARSITLTWKLVKEFPELPGGFQSRKKAGTESLKLIIKFPDSALMNRVAVIE
jgi:hypothetical protein